jgi:hypothetical protein
VEKVCSKEHDLCLYFFRSFPHQQQSHQQQQERSKQPNIIMIMIDNISRRVFRQRLPKTIKVLERLDKNQTAHHHVYDFLLASVSGATSQVI